MLLRPQPNNTKQSGCSPQNISFVNLMLPKCVSLQKLFIDLYNLCPMCERCFRVLFQTSLVPHVKNNCLGYNQMVLGSCEVFLKQIERESQVLDLTFFDLYFTFFYFVYLLTFYRYFLPGQTYFSLCSSAVDGLYIYLLKLGLLKGYLRRICESAPTAISKPMF